MEADQGGRGLWAALGAGLGAGEGVCRALWGSYSEPARGGMRWSGEREAASEKGESSAMICQCLVELLHLIGRRGR